MKNRIVARFADGRMLKGVTNDFFPNKPSFHITLEEGGHVYQVRIADLKAIFFVKSFEGNDGQVERRVTERNGLGRKAKVSFRDGEMILGYASSYSKQGLGFFVFPADTNDNNEKIFVVHAATQDVQIFGPPVGNA